MKQKTLLQRAEELRQKELTLREITAILLSEGYTTKRGTPINLQAVHYQLNRLHYVQRMRRKRADK